MTLRSLPRIPALPRSGVPFRDAERAPRAVRRQQDERFRLPAMPVALHRVIRSVTAFTDRHVLGARLALAMGRCWLATSVLLLERRLHRACKAWNRHEARRLKQQLETTIERAVAWEEARHR
ncbi:MAG TPA: hypothetical protein VEA16_19515 [Vicinamibacterales bacterium]|nr:hypothetical protein [Vicinamibacterales bacterium]